MNKINIDRIARNISSAFEERLSSAGIFFRIFHRTKESESIERKIGIKQYDGIKNSLQDIIGIRVNFYFADDIEIITPLLKQMFRLVGETVDKNEETEFKPTRSNFVFAIPEEFLEEFRTVIKESKVDATFELQLRTVLSEGWHEVDHDMRYKCKNDWAEHSDLGRMFNGIFASLEASDWAILQLFSKLSYRHYLARSYEAMLRAKMRIRFRNGTLKTEILDTFNEDPELVKKIFKLERVEVITTLFKSRLRLPITIDLIIYFINFFYLGNPRLSQLTPQLLIKEFSLL